MTLVLGLLKGIFEALKSFFLMLIKVIKFILQKCWKFILLVVSLLIGLFSAKKAMKEE